MLGEIPEFAEFRGLNDRSRDCTRQGHVEILAGGASFPHSHSSYRCIDHRHSPTQLCSSSDSSIPVDIRVPACRSSIPSEAISRIEAIITNSSDTKLTNGLPEDAAQTLIDSMQEVRLHIPSLPKLGLIVFALFGSFTFNLSDIGSSRSPIATPSELFKHSVPHMRSSGFASEISTNPTLLQPIGLPAV